MVALLQTAVQHLQKTNMNQQIAKGEFCNVVVSLFLDK